MNLNYSTSLSSCLIFFQICMNQTCTSLLPLKSYTRCPVDPNNVECTGRGVRNFMTYHLNINFFLDLPWELQIGVPVARFPRLLVNSRLPVAPKSTQCNRGWGSVFKPHSMAHSLYTYTYCDIVFYLLLLLPLIWNNSNWVIIFFLPTWLLSSCRMGVLLLLWKEWIKKDKKNWF